MKKIFALIFFLIILLTLPISFNNKNQKETIKFSSWGTQSEIKILTRLLNDFEKKNNVKIEFIHIPQNYFQKLHLLFASNLEPDVILINNHNIKMYTDADLLEDLTPFFDKERNNFFQTAIDCLSSDNRIYAVPRDISNLVLYINKDIFKSANIDYKTRINTLNELKNTAEKLSVNNKFGINYEEDSLYWLYFLSANGGGIISDDLKNIIINKEESLQALNLYSDFANKYHIAPTKAQIGSMTTAQMFINGKLAMYLGGRWMVPKFREMITFDWDIAEFPSNKERKVYVDASGWAVSKKSKQKENAIKLIKFLSSRESMEEFSQSGLIIPAEKMCAEKYIINDTENKPAHARIFITMLENAKPTPVNKNYRKINDILKEQLQSVFSGEEKAENAIDENTIRKLKGLI